MDKKKLVKEAIYDSIDEVNDQLLPQQRIDKEINTILIGKDAKIDSMALVNLLVSIEDKIEKKFDTNISLFNEEAFGREDSYLKTINTLIKFIENKID